LEIAAIRTAAMPGYPGCSTTIGFADGDDYFCRLVAA